MKVLIGLVIALSLAVGGCSKETNEAISSLFDAGGNVLRTSGDVLGHGLSDVGDGIANIGHE